MAFETPQSLSPPAPGPGAGHGNAPADFARCVHRSLDPLATAFAIVNELKRQTGCDRASLVQCGPSGARLLATSGLDVVEPRATAVRALEDLAVTLCRSAPNADDSGEDAASTSLRHEAIARYRGSSRAADVWVFPLCLRADGLAGSASATPAPRVGCLVVEHFERGTDDIAMSHQLDELVPHAELAFANAVRAASRPLAGASRVLESLPGMLQVWRFPRRVLWLALVVAASLVLTLVPAEFSIKTRGRLVPQRRQHVFAGVDGVVDQIHVEQGASVTEGQLLLLLRSSSLDYETSRVLGELQTARSRLESIRTSLIGGGQDASPGSEADRLVLEEKELQELVISLTAQETLLARQRAELELRAPLAGRVTTWDAQRLLAARPVQRGQRLLTIADLDGPWLLELELPDHHVGHVSRAAVNSSSPLRVTFVIPSDAGRPHRAELAEISTTVELDESGAAVVPVTAAVAGETSGLKPGVTALARLHCGRRALGYVWFHDFVDTLRAWLWL